MQQTEKARLHLTLQLLYARRLGLTDNKHGNDLWLQLAFIDTYTHVTNSLVKVTTILYQITMFVTHNLLLYNDD